MGRQVKIWSVVMMIVLASSYAVALQGPAPQQAGPSTHLVLSGQDVITASDAGGGTLSQRDLLVMIAIGVGILILIAVI